MRWIHGFDGSPVRIAASLTLLVTLSVRPAAAQKRGSDPARQALLDRFPGVRIQLDGDWPGAVFGRPMTRGWRPEEAANRWIADHTAVWGVGDVDLRQVRATMLGSRRSTVFSYQQFMAGLPVEYGIARIYVRHGRPNDVVFVGANLVRPPDNGFGPMTVSGRDAVASVKSNVNYSHFLNWSAPELVVFPEETARGAIHPFRAWRFYGEFPEVNRYEAYTFFVDAADGRLAFVRNEVYHADAAGSVHGFGSIGTLPDVDYNPPGLIPLSSLFVRGGGVQTETDNQGFFELTDAGSAPINIEADLSGSWVTVNDVRGGDLRAEQLVSPPALAEMVLNEAPGEFATAQVNGFYYTTLTHDYYKQLQPDFDGLDIPITCNVNSTRSCNAFFSPISLAITFFSAGQGCVNTAYSSVITHEYGHFIVNRHNLRQEGFGEGYADALALLMYDDHLVGRDFLGPDTFVRDTVRANKQYPCFEEAHACGQVLSGIWWELKLELQKAHGPVQGLEIARQLFTDWTEITVGIRRGLNSADPRTAVEVLAVDDEDGDFTNGTPNESGICAAFEAHGIPCDASCGAIQRIRATCRRGTGEIRAAVVADVTLGTAMELTLDAADPRSATFNGFGRATATWEGVADGEHIVCIANCPASCRTVTCRP